MHMLICAIVYAVDEDTALEEAQSIFETLCEHEHFDYYQTFDEGGKDRWGDLPIVAKVNNKEGKKLINDGMKNTRECFTENLKVIREALKVKADEELFEDGYFKSHLHWAGMHSGQSIWLYDNNGSGIENSEHLKDVLNKWKCFYKDVPAKQNPYKNTEVFVVPADVHF